MLIAEEFVLLALDPDGTLVRGGSNQPAAAVGVQGALVTELAQVLDNIEAHDGKKLKSRLASIRHSGRNEVIDAMSAAVAASASTGG